MAKDISLANTEEDAIKRILEEDHEPINKPISNRKSISEFDGKENYHKDEINRSKIDPSMLPIIPKGEPKTSPSVTQEPPEVMHRRDGQDKKEDERDLSELSAIRELINLQEKTNGTKRLNRKSTED